ncbi:MAG: GntR family transcriptional regulator [bacterium]
MAIDMNVSAPLYVQVANDIKAKIVSGALKAGDQLATQSELAKQYSVSLITIKKAISELIREGVVYARAGKGTYITKSTNRVDFSKLKTIGFVLRDLESPFFSRILSSVEKTLSEERYNLLLSSTAGRDDKEDTMIQHFLEIGVSGLIIASMSREYIASPIIRQLHREHFPYVVVSYIADEDITYVGTDHEEGAFIATEHLISLGYKKIGYINGVSGERGSLLGDLRKKGFLRALHHHKMEYSPKYEYRFQLRGEWNDYQSGYQIGLEFSSASDRPDAIFAFDDLSALGFQKAVLDKGLGVPKDIAIVGFDDIRRGVTAPVPLTTVHQPLAEIGEAAVDILLRTITGQPVQTRRILKPSLVIRESCGAILHKSDKHSAVRGFGKINSLQFKPSRRKTQKG